MLPDSPDRLPNSCHSCQKLPSQHRGQRLAGVGRRLSRGAPRYHALYVQLVYLLELHVAQRGQDAPPEVALVALPRVRAQPRLLRPVHLVDELRQRDARRDAPAQALLLHEQAGLRLAGLPLGRVRLHAPVARAVPLDADRDVGRPLAALQLPDRHDVQSPCLPSIRLVLAWPRAGLQPLCAGPISFDLLIGRCPTNQLAGHKTNFMSDNRIR